MFGMGWGELMVLALVGLFVLGPERLPDAIRWITTTIQQIKTHVAAAKEHLDSAELAEFRKPLDELREPLAELRSLDPRRTMRTGVMDALIGQAATTPPAKESTTSQSSASETSPSEPLMTAPAPPAAENTKTS